MKSHSTQILALSGSLRALSSNTSLLLAAQKLTTVSLEIEIYSGLGDLPHFNPDLDTDSPPLAVAQFRAALQNAAGIMICTPEYAHGLPGSLKNALDWTVSSGTWMEKPTLILKSSRSNFAHSSLVEILTTLMAKISVASISLPGNSLDAAAMLRDEEIAGELRHALENWAI